MKEVDLLLGSYVDRHLGSLTDAMLDQLEALLECGDPDIYNWVTGRAEAPPSFQNELMQSLKAHRYQFDNN